MERAAGPSNCRNWLQGAEPPHGPHAGPRTDGNNSICCRTALIAMRRVSGSLVGWRAMLHSHRQATCSWGRPALWGRSLRLPKSPQPSHCSSAGAAAGAPAARAGAVAEAAEQQAPQAPLCERPAAHAAELASLLAWRERALQAIGRVGDAWVQLDEGPSQADLEVGGGRAGAGQRVIQSGLSREMLNTLQTRPCCCARQACIST